MPTFHFITYVYRGPTEREHEVEVTYSVTPGRAACLYGDYPHPAEPDEIEIVSANADGVELYDHEWDSIYDEACDRADQDMAEYHADAAEYLRDLRSDAA